MQAMAWAEKQYHQCLLDSPEAEPARRYLQERGITAESSERFHLGFSPPERASILRGAGAASDKAKLVHRQTSIDGSGATTNLRSVPGLPSSADTVGQANRGTRAADQAKLARRAKVLETVGILARPAEGGSPYDRFKGRLLFSIRDGQGRPVGIGGRVLPEATPEGDSPIFAEQKSGQSPRKNRDSPPEPST